jgi:Uma2 family endonuclease
MNTTGGCIMSIDDGDLSKDKSMAVKESAEPLYSSEQRYTYADYASWETEDRYELIDGRAYIISAPSQAHQSIVGELHGQFWNYLKGKPCKVLLSPFDVCLFGLGDDDYTVVQPDLIIVCEKSKLDGKRCNGAPDLAIEVLSPSSRTHDRLRKFNKYLEAGVREYWIVDPDDKYLTAHVLNGEQYTTKMYDDSSNAPVFILDGFEINMSDVFDA